MSENKDRKNTDFGLFEVDYESYLSQHDVVYLSPATEGFEGLPIGNGDLTAMMWTPPEQICWQINKCDLWDDAPDGNFEHWKKNWEEKATCLRSAGVLSITNNSPAYDWRYLKDFDARIQMYSAQASVCAETSFSSTKVTSFVSKADRCLVVQYEDQLQEQTPKQISLRRWGSRTFAHSFHQIVKDTTVGLEGIESGCDSQHVWIVQKTRSLTFAVACRVVGIEFDTQKTHSRQAVFNTIATDNAKFQVYLSVVTSEEDPDPLAAAVKLVDEACEKGCQAVVHDHRKNWADFWPQSFINIPDKYIENIWYFNLYQTASASSGKCPPNHSNGLWYWNNDICMWNHYYHWNLQQYTWFLHSSGHPELFEPYARLRRDGLVHAMEDATKVFNCRGAWYADIANRRGYQPIVFQEDIDKNAKPGEIQVDHGTTDNLTPGAQIAMDLYRHYQYTLDEDFLKEYAYPVMRESVRFYCDYVQREDDGRYHIPKSCPYEGNGLCKDAVTDLACICQLFPRFIDTAKYLKLDEQLSKEASEVLENLADYVTMEVPEGVIAKGMEESPGPILAAGVNLEEQGGPYHHWLGDSPGKKRVVFESVHIAPIFPASLVGLDQKGTEEFEILERTLRCFDPQSMLGIFVYLIAQARMGLKELMEEGLRNWVQNYQGFCQGFFSIYPRDPSKTEQISHSCGTVPHPAETWAVEIIGGGKGEMSRIPKRPFVHFDTDPGGIFQTTINEMLLQSYSNRIHVFPAMPEEWTGCFVLHAIGGFVVASEKTTDGISYVTIISRKGQQCRLVNPWHGSETVSIYNSTNNEYVTQSVSDEELCFETTVDCVYHIQPAAVAMKNHQGHIFSGKCNKAPKKLGNAVLGKPGLF